MSESLRVTSPTAVSQHGTILAIALIFLVLLSMLGFSVMSVSQQELQMASQFVAQAQAQEQAETCLNEAQTEAAILIDTHLNVPDGSFITKAGHINVADGAPQAAVSNPDWWHASGDALPCVTGGRYVIEYLGVQDMILPNDRYTGITHKMHALRIAAQGTSASGANVALQAIFLRNSL